MMEIFYKKSKIKKQLSTASNIKKAFGVHARKVVSRLDDIEASPNLTVLMQIPAANCHRLSGKRSDQWALNVSNNFRMIFELTHDPLPMLEDNSINTEEIISITIIEIIDYH